MTGAPILTEDDCRCVLETKTLIDESFGNAPRGGKRP
jgi:hypothetical protein